MQRLMFTGNSTKRNRQPVPLLTADGVRLTRFGASKTLAERHTACGRRRHTCDSGFRSTTHVVMTEDFESLRHSRYFASKRPTVGVLHEIALAFIRVLHRPITAKCLVFGLIAHTGRLDALLDMRVHLP